MQNTKNILQAALDYQAKGLSVMPVGANKKPLLDSWKEYQKRRASPDEIKSWLERYPDMNIAIITGKISGLVVVDIEKSGRSEGYPPTVTAKSGGEGIHLYYKHPGYEVRNGAKVRELTDIRGDGGYIIAPPSVSYKGEYQWILSMDDSDFSDLPDWIAKPTTSKNSDKKWLAGKDGVAEGSRNDVAASMAGKILSSMDPELWETLGWEQLLIWNQKNPKPLAEKELRGTFESIKSYGPNDSLTEGKKNQAEILLEIVDKKENVTLFHDDKKDAYISLRIGGHKQILAMKSKAVRRWLVKEFWQGKKKKAINAESVKNAIAVLEGRACYDGPLYELHNRLAWSKGDLWYDLTNDQWQAIKINDKGWEVVDEPPILFARYPHSQAQVIPASKGGDINLIFKYINISNPESKLLLLVYLISCFIPDFPHPILVIFGPQGSAKSTLSRLLRRIVDPSLIEVASMPDNQKELVQVLAHHAFLFFDNVSYVSEVVSDILCKAVTGSGFVKRELYTDDEDVIYRFKRCIGINGINLVSTRPDLLDRSLLLELDRIEDEQRKTDQEIMDDFEQDLPLILGGIFDVLVKTLQIKPTIKLTDSPRMADFALWGSAISEVIEATQEAFLNAYQNNIAKQTETILNENMVAMVLMAFIEDCSTHKWEGTMSELLYKLDKHAPFVNININDKYWPKAPNVLSRTLNVLKITLRSADISIVISAGQKRKVTIEKISTIGTGPASKPIIKSLFAKDDNDDRDDIIPTSAETTPPVVLPF